VVELDLLGNYLGDLPSCGTYPTGLAFGPDGKLYIASRDTNSVFRYDTTTDTCLGECVASGYGGLASPYGLTFDSQGHLFVSSGGNNQVIQYDLTWQFVRTYSNGALVNPRGLAFHPGGDLLVASSGTAEVLRFDAQTGAYGGVFTAMGAGPGAVVGLAYGPNGYLYVVTYGGGVVRIYEVNGETGVSWRTFNRADPDLDSPAGLAFYPSSPDDLDGNGIPDECEVPTADAPTDHPWNSGNNRYLSLRPGNTGQEVALLVTLISSNTFPGSAGQCWWVSEPGAGSVSALEHAALQCDPVYLDWTPYCDVDLAIHVGDANIVPDSTYEIRAIASGCAIDEPGNYSAPLSISTSMWGDVAGYDVGDPPEGIVDFNDVSAEVDGFTHSPMAVSLWALNVSPEDIQDCSDPGLHACVDFLDISYVADAFRDWPYPFSAPPLSCTCPY
jgi:hypothetical protein